MSLDETCLSNGEVWTFLTNKEGHGGRGTLAAALPGIKSDETISILISAMGKSVRRKVIEVTCDLSPSIIRLEGSFGTQKQHYSLSRIKARNRETEILWIFFGIHTANAILMIDKIKKGRIKWHDMALQTKSEETIGLLPEHHGLPDKFIR